MNVQKKKYVEGNELLKESFPVYFCVVKLNFIFKIFSWYSTRIAKKKKSLKKKIVEDFIIFYMHLPSAYERETQSAFHYKLLFRLNIVALKKIKT